MSFLEDFLGIVWTPSENIPEAASDERVEICHVVASIEVRNIKEFANASEVKDVQMIAATN